MSANIRTLNCPHCGAPLEYSGDAPTIRCPFCQTVVIVPAEIRGASTPAKPEPPEMAEVRQRLKAGDKIGAIKLYRRLYPVGLAEAKDAVEIIERDATGEPLPVDNETPTSPQATQGLDEVKRQLRAGNKIAAIKAYRSIYNVGLAEAKAACRPRRTQLCWVAPRPSPPTKNPARPNGSDWGCCWRSPFLA